ncbi:urease accessory protein UreD [Solwaraspora sp. WMMA2080]|uniref:urease accessory protein UreD n=1 Tax=unclassified Solwaraspora TaxID=2627926 RepID=UPI00248CFE4D|nr:MULTISPECIES: urease accessory protein UreD [unclassified Solwaraspora]WBB99173.1 urease accessory protein UreD [Solwaraspora sp. WMMA2059]WBC22274.1 urease accessory protein UreD [Solwaraspora sp. WMMA2080]
MRAHARLVAEVDAAGRTRLVCLRGEPPLVLRRTGPAAAADGGEVQVHLVGAAAGPLGGDDLRLDVEVGPGARVCLRTVAASLALPGPDGRRSTLQMLVRVATGGELRWLPEPLIAAAGCHHLSRSVVELADGAAVVWREELVCGRDGEPSGDARIDTTVRYAGRTVLRTDLAVGPRADGWAGPAVLAGAKATGSVLVVRPEWAAGGPPAAGPLGPGAARLPLAGGPAVLVTATGPTARGVRAELDRAEPDRAEPDRAGAQPPT